MKSVSVGKEQTDIQQIQLNGSRVGQPAQDTAQKEKKTLSSSVNVSHHNQFH